MLNCRQALEMLAELVEGTLGADAKRSLDGHLTGCPPCERLVQGYRTTTALCRESLRKEAPTELRERLMTYLRRHCCCDDDG